MRDFTCPQKYLCADLRVTRGTSGKLAILFRVGKIKSSTDDFVWVHEQFPTIRVNERASCFTVLKSYHTDSVHELDFDAWQSNDLNRQEQLVLPKESSSGVLVHSIGMELI